MILDIHARALRSPAGLAYLSAICQICQTGRWQYLQAVSKLAACHGIVYQNMFHDYLRNLILTQDRLCKHARREIQELELRNPRLIIVEGTFH